MLFPTQKGGKRSLFAILFHFDILISGNKFIECCMGTRLKSILVGVDLEARTKTGEQSVKANVSKKEHTDQ